MNVSGDPCEGCSLEWWWGAPDEKGCPHFHSAELIEVVRVRWGEPRPWVGWVEVRPTCYRTYGYVMIRKERVDYYEGGADE